MRPGTLAGSTMEGTTPRRTGARRRALLAFGLSSVVSFAGGELVCRSSFGVPLEERLPILHVRANARRGYEMIPGGDHNTYEHAVRVNSLGLRGPQVPEKAANEVRVLCLGDSLTYGQGVAEEDTLPALLERALAESSAARASASEPAPTAKPPTIRVVNGGLRGYGTAHELALLEDVADAVRPDVVVLLWYPNDLEPPKIEDTYAKFSDPRFRGDPVAFDTERRMEGAALFVWRARQVLRGSAFLMELHDVWTEHTAPRLNREQIERGFQRLDGYFARFAELAQAKRFDLLVAVVPTAAELRGPERADRPARRVEVLARAHALPCVDLTPDLRALTNAAHRLPVLPYDGHYTADANRAMARTLATTLAGACPSRF